MDSIIFRCLLLTELHQNKNVFFESSVMEEIDKIMIKIKDIKGGDGVKKIDKKGEKMGRAINTG